MATKKRLRNFRNISVGNGAPPTSGFIRDDVIYFVDEVPTAHGIFDKPQETTTMCYCKVCAVMRTEFWKAYENGISPEYLFKLSEYADYRGQKLLLYNGKRYRVVKSYVSNNAVELVAAPATADAELPAREAEENAGSTENRS